MGQIRGKGGGEGKRGSSATKESTIRNISETELTNRINKQETLTNNYNYYNNYNYKYFQ